MTIRLSQTAPWDSALGNPYRTRWAQVGDRMFKVSTDCLNGVWSVEQVTADGQWILDSDVRIAMTLAEAREAIAELAAGPAPVVPTAEQRRAILAAL